jgi:hypothetical protein
LGHLLSSGARHNPSAHRGIGGSYVDAAAGPSSANRLEQQLADLKRPVGETLRFWRDPMLEMRVQVHDSTGAIGLMQGLVRLFGRSSISFDRSNNVVRVESEWESRAVVGVVEVVEAWLEEGGAESATMSLGHRSYTLLRSTPLPVSS